MAFGVSNSFKRGTVKTYSRQRARLDNSDEIDRPQKRMRMDAPSHTVEHDPSDEPRSTHEPVQDVGQKKEQGPKEGARSSSITAPSSPPAAERALCSSDVLSSDSELSSLPSSPPQMPSPVPVPRKPAFSFLKRKRAANDDGRQSRALSSITPNAQKTPRPAAKKAMTQMQIDLGGDMWKTCRTCGMEYVPSVKEDAQMHKDFCGLNTGGIELGRPFFKDESLKRVRSEKPLKSENEMIVVIDRRSSPALRNKAKKVLGIVNAELSAADLEENQLWGDVEGEEIENSPTGKRIWGTRTGVEKRPDRFKVFLHLIGDKCVGFCLTEKINKSFPVVSVESGERAGETSKPLSNSSSISHSASVELALLGISRIWISKPHRAQGLAVNLLECARSNFFFGIQVPKHLVAFSQPTESGGHLAKRWFGTETGWHVYRGSQL